MIEYLSGFVREDISLYYIIRLESKINYSLPLISHSTALKIHVTPNLKQTFIYKPSADYSDWHFLTFDSKNT